VSWQALNWCAALHDVKGGRRALLWAMSNRHNAKTGLITMSTTTLAEESGLSRSTAYRLLQALERDGLVVEAIPGRGPNHPAAYQLPSHVDGTVVQSAQADEPSHPDGTMPATEPSHPGETKPSHSQVQPSHPDGTEPSHPRARAYKSYQPKDFEPSQRAGVAAPPDGGAAPRSQPGGVPPDVTAALAALKATMHADLQAARQAEAKRARDLLGEAATEATG